MHILKNDRKPQPENERMENARHGKRWKMHTLENDRKVTTRKCTTWKMHNMKKVENAYTRK